MQTRKRPVQFLKMDSTKAALAGFGIVKNHAAKSVSTKNTGLKAPKIIKTGKGGYKGR